MASFQVRLRGLFSSKEEPDRNTALPEVTAGSRGPKSFAEDSNDFALVFHGQLRQQPGNLLFSPFPHLPR